MWNCNRSVQKAWISKNNITMNRHKLWWRAQRKMTRMPWWWWKENPANWNVYHYLHIIHGSCILVQKSNATSVIITIIIFIFPIGFPSLAHPNVVKAHEKCAMPSNIATRQLRYFCNSFLTDRYSWKEFTHKIITGASWTYSEHCSSAGMNIRNKSSCFK